MQFVNWLMNCGIPEVNKHPGNSNNTVYTDKGMCNKKSDAHAMEYW